MSDLISRSALIEAIKDRQKCFWDSEEINDEYCNIITLVNAQPTVEAKPVVKGEWVLRGGRARCSQCGTLALMDKDRDDWWYHKQSNFCPECGCDMRKKVE